MFDRELVQYAYTLGYARALVADVPDDRLADQPTPGVNHPAWVLGHLAVVTDLGLELLGRPRGVPADWHELFASGRVPSPERGIYPSKAALVEGFVAAHDRLADAVRSDADPARLAGPNPLEGMRASFPTAADLLAHLLTTHLAVHHTWASFRRGGGSSGCRPSGPGRRPTWIRARFASV